MIPAAFVDTFKENHAHRVEAQARHAEHEAEFQRELEALCKLAGYSFEGCYQRPGVYIIADAKGGRVSGTLVELANTLLS